jgi:large subunit ribosomal protein L24
MQKIKRGDTVKILSGKERGKTGEVVAVLLKEGKVVVKGINIVTRHKKQTANEKGGLIKVESPISIGRAMLVDPKTGKPTRVRFELDKKTGKKTRVSTKTGKPI